MTNCNVFCICYCTVWMERHRDKFLRTFKCLCRINILASFYNTEYFIHPITGNYSVSLYTKRAIRNKESKQATKNISLQCVILYCIIRYWIPEETGGRKWTWANRGSNQLESRLPSCGQKQATERGRGRGVVLEYIMIIIIIMGISMAHDP